MLIHSSKLSTKYLSEEEVWGGEKDKRETETENERERERERERETDRQTDRQTEGGRESNSGWYYS